MVGLAVARGHGRAFGQEAILIPVAEQEFAEREQVCVVAIG